MKEQPLVSLITVTYNSSSYVRDAIDSVLTQTYKNIEFIIGDDCSTDATWDIICSYHDDRIIKYRNASNLKEYPNRNKAISLARGKYIKFIDGDDIIYPHGIEFFVTQMEAFPEAVLAIQKEYTNNILFPAILTPQQTISNSIFGTNMLNSSFTSDMYRTKELIAIGKLSTQYNTGDAEIRYRLAFKYPILYIAGWVSWPRETPGQASTRLKHGIEIVEYCDYIDKLIHSSNISFSDPIFIDSIKIKLFQYKIRVILSQIKNLRWLIAKKYMKLLNINCRDILFNFFQSSTFPKDELSHYTPAKPYRNGFLSRGV